MGKNILAALFGGTKHDKDMRRLNPIVAAVNSQVDWAKGLSHEDMVAQTAAWKEAVRAGKTTLDEILPMAFAMAREASARESAPPETASRRRCPVFSPKAAQACATARSRRAAARS